MRNARAIAVIVLAAIGSATPAAGIARNELSASSPPRGSWQPASYRVAGSIPVMVGTRTANGSPVYVAWIDHRSAELALYPGLSEPAFASPRGPAQVPFGQRWRLLATFNSGFKSAAGAGGFIVNGRVYEPMRYGLGTLVEYRNGTVDILEWRGRTHARTLVLARQNLSPLVWAGRPTAATADAYQWGATLGGGTAAWRTAVGVTASGDLVYAAGGNQTPASIAGVMVELGAARAIELDINPEWASFNGYRRRGGRDPLKVVPNPQQSATRYLTPDSRDFFAVYTRAGGGPSVPLR